MKLRNSTNIWLFKELKVIFCSIITVGGKTQRMPSTPPQHKANPIVLEIISLYVFLCISWWYKYDLSLNRLPVFHSLQSCESIRYVRSHIFTKMDGTISNFENNWGKKPHFSNFELCSEVSEHVKKLLKSLIVPTHQRYWKEICIANLSFAVLD